MSNKMAEMSTEAEEALTSVKMAGLRKKINAGSWNDNMENLMKMWGEKSAGLRFMHDNAAGSWRHFSNTLTLWSIGITTIASGVSLIAASIDDEQTKNIILYIVGGVGIGSSLLQSLKKFYNAEEKAADHNAVARQFGSFYRYMTLQLNLTREDRLPSDQLSEFALKEYERMILESPPLGATQISLFRKAFLNSQQAVPDVCEKEFNINVYEPPNLVKSKIIKVKEVEVDNITIEVENGENGEFDNNSTSSDASPLH